MEPSVGAGLVFISLPNVFDSALQSVPFFGWLIPTAFYVILFMAAITSCIFLHEVSTAFIAERANLSRHKAAAIVSLAAFIIGCGASLSMGPWSDPIFFGMNFFDFLDYFTAKLILPLTGMGAALFVGWKMTTRQLWSELTSYRKSKVLMACTFTRSL